jgi:hypothetical protein
MTLLLVSSWFLHPILDVCGHPVKAKSRGG